MSNRLWVGLCLALAACGGDVKGNVPDAPSSTGSDASVAVDALTADQACNASAQDRCTKLMTCSPVDLEKRFGDLATCEARQKLACTDALAAPNTGNTPDDEVACGAALAAQSCSDFLTADPPNACLRQMGTQTGGCAFPAQCTTAFCALADGALCGTCEAQPVAGDSCADHGCGQGLTCVSATQTCQVPRTVNQSCDKSQPCENGLNCVGATVTASGACQAQGATAGATCDPTHKTAPDCNDDDDLTCNSTTGKCVTQPIASINQPCGVTAGIRTACAGGATCEIPANQTTGTCIAPASDGAACDTAAGPGCLFPAKCIPTTVTGTAGSCLLPGTQTCP